MKILLIDIPTVLGSKNIRIYPPMWVAYLSSYLKADMDYFDARVENATLEKHTDRELIWWTYGMSMDNLVNFILNRQFNILGIHIGVSTELGIATKLVQQLKIANKKIRIILGGAGIAFVPKKFLNPVFRECEICPTTLFGKKLNVNLPMKDYKDYNINTLPDNNIYQKYEEEYRKLNRFHSGPPIISPAGQIMTSVGCGGHCSFCTTRSQNRIERTFSSVKAELNILKEKGIGCIQFEDDNLFGWKFSEMKRGISILRLASEIGFYGIEFPNGLTVKSMLDEHFLHWISDTLDRKIKIKIGLPFESTSDDILRIIHKPHRYDMCVKLAEKIEPFIRKGLQAEIFLQIGMAWLENGQLVTESDSSIEKTANFARELKSQGFISNIFFNSPIPGTDLFPIWRKKFPSAPWERLLLTEPSLFYDKEKRLWLKQIFHKINNSPRI